MRYTRTYLKLEAARAGMKNAEAQKHRVLHENHFYRDLIDAEGFKTQVMDRVEVEYDDAPDTAPLPVVHWKALYQAAPTVADKLDVLARHAGLR